MILQQVTDSFVHICTGMFASLLNEYILSNPQPDACCTTVEPEKLDSESDSKDTTTTEMSDTLSEASATITARLPSPHPSHTAHHIYYYIHH